jgi:hypothetical protein
MMHGKELRWRGGPAAAVLGAVLLMAVAGTARADTLAISE